MEKKKYRKGDILVHEGEPQERMYVIASGETYREKTIQGQVQQNPNHHQLIFSLIMSTQNSAAQP
jgi:signal-transduction protein with cAMP-binding, CBS, and nucleotidyltransferase domain